MQYSAKEKTLILFDSIGLDYTKKAAVFKDAGGTLSYIPDRERLILSTARLVGEKESEKLKEVFKEKNSEEIFSSYEKKKIGCVTVFSEDYPELLSEIPNPPFVLYCRGNISLLRARKFAVVGSRRTLPQILKLTEKYASDLAEYFTIVTGLADGGDTAAIKGGLESGKLISVLAYGFDFVYPECNRHLLEKITQKGLAISEYIPSASPQKHMFPFRNRIIAGLSEGVLVVSGGTKSGTKITAKYAYEYGRDVFAFPYTPGIVSGEGCNAIIKEYAKLTDNLVDITSAFGINLTEKEEITLSAAEKAVYFCLREGEKHLSEISEKTGIVSYELMPVLTLLEIKKLIVRCGGNRYCAVVFSNEE